MRIWRALWTVAPNHEGGCFGGCTGRESKGNCGCRLSDRLSLDDAWRLPVPQRFKRDNQRLNQNNMGSQRGNPMYFRIAQHKTQPGIARKPAHFGIGDSKYRNPALMRVGYGFENRIRQFVQADDDQ